MKSLIVCIAVFFSISLKSQLGNEKDWKIVGIIMCTRLEATSIDNKAFLSLGPKIPINENNYVSLRGHFNWRDVPGRKFIVIPELDYFRKIGSFSDDSITNLYLGAGITPNTVSPKVGVNFIHLFSAEFGYNFEYDTYKHFATEGFRFSIGINLVL